MDMEERRKIVISTDFDPEETLSRQYFDTEATLTARPVVPLSDAEAAASSSAVSAALPASAATAVLPKQQSGRRWVVPAVIAAALVVGLVAGVGVIAYQRSRQPQTAQAGETPQAVSPIAEKTRSVLPWTHTPDEVIPEEDATVPVPDENATATTAQPRQDNTPHPNEARDEKRREQAEAAREDRRAQLEQEREERKQDRPRKRDRDGRNNEDLPQDPLIRRTQDELHRVREIFEGTP
ncbi:MAG: hypothetical protein JO360_03605 [Acidobacteria bacterium]|nr:hypothetical protein [Acidobacteriota bacterium]